MTDEPQYYYRVTDVLYSSGSDEWGDPIPRTPGTCIELVWRKYLVVSHTKTGVWIHFRGGRRFISRNWTKQFALPSKDEAMVSFIARKKKQLSIYRARIADAETALRLTDKQACILDD